MENFIRVPIKEDYLLDELNARCGKELGHQLFAVLKDSHRLEILAQILFNSLPPQRHEFGKGYTFSEEQVECEVMSYNQYSDYRQYEIKYKDPTTGDVKVEWVSQYSIKKGDK